MNLNSIYQEKKVAANSGCLIPFAIALSCSLCTQGMAALAEDAGNGSIKAPTASDGKTQTTSTLDRTGTANTNPSSATAKPAPTSSSTSSSNSTSTSSTSPTTTTTTPPTTTTSESGSTSSTSTPTDAPRMKPWPEEQLAAPAVVAPKAAEKEAPPPAGMDAALKLYGARKWALAQKSFEEFIKNGSTNVQVHQCLANCYYYQKIYSKAQVQFDWIAKNEKHISAKRAAENTARVLKCYRAGVCPAPCLKANDPRWHKLPGHGDEMWMTFSGTDGSHSWSEHHIGQIITYVKGNPVNDGTCPTCGGTGTVKVLKDGAAPPQQ